MMVGKAVETLRGLKAPQKDRLHAYSYNLLKDKDPSVFDDVMYNYLEEVVNDRKWLRKTKNYLDSIGWNQSKYQYSQMEEQLFNFTLPNHPRFSWNKCYIQAKENILKEFKRFRLKSLHYSESSMMLEYLPRTDSHAGWSYIETGLRYKGDYCEELYQMYSKEENTARINGSFNKPILMGVRTQASNPFNEDGTWNYIYKGKTRLVSMVDINQIFGELRFSRELQSELGGSKWYAGGKDDSILTALIRRNRRKFNNWISIDYSKYDQSISDWLIRDAFDIIREAYFYDSSFDEELFRIVREDFINKVFIDGHGKCIQSNKGVPSGSMFTQIVDSIVNRLMIETYFNSISETCEMMIMGDDNIIFSDVEIDLNHLSTYLSKNFGIVMNPDKCKSGSNREDPEFLSRKWTEYGIDRNSSLLVAKLLFPERFRKYHDGEVHPGMIVQCYVDAFPVGMKRILDREYEWHVCELTSSIGKARWLDGLLRYRLLYNAS